MRLLFIYNVIEQIREKCIYSLEIYFAHVVLKTLPWLLLF